MKNISNQRGFTTLELSMVLMVFGTIFLTVMAAFNLYSKQHGPKATETAMINSNGAVLEYIANFGVYPCPADPQLGPGDAMYGREMRVGPITDPGDPNYDRQPCAVFGEIKRVNGRDTTQDNETPPVGDNVLIGALPFESIIERLEEFAGGVFSEFSEGQSVDGWGNKLKYAVSENLTNKSTYNSFWGAIDIVEEQNNSLLNESEDKNSNGLLDPGEDNNNNGVLDLGRYAHFALLSMGENGLGAYARNGTLVQPCVSGVIIPGGPGATEVNEKTNCNDIDGIFLSGLRIEREDSYNDDFTKFTTYDEASLWRFVGAGKIANTNPGFVGMGTDQPEQRLHVSNNIDAQQVHAAAFTDRTMTKNAIVPAVAMAGWGEKPDPINNAVNPDSQRMQCAQPGWVVTQVNYIQVGDVMKPQVICGAAFGTTPPPNLTCPKVGNNQFVMYGIESTSKYMLGGSIEELDLEQDSSALESSTIDSGVTGTGGLGLGSSGKGSFPAIVNISNNNAAPVNALDHEAIISEGTLDGPDDGIIIPDGDGGTIGGTINPGAGGLAPGGGVIPDGGATIDGSVIPGHSGGHFVNGIKILCCDLLATSGPNVCP